MAKDNAYCSERCRDAHSKQSLGVMDVGMKSSASGGGLRRNISHSQMGSTCSGGSSLATLSSQSSASLVDTYTVRFEPCDPISEAIPFRGIIDKIFTGVFEGLAHVGSDAMHTF